MIKAEANPKTLNCPKCAAVLPTPGLGDSGMMACPNCGTDARVVVFPALFRDEAKPVVAESVMGDGEASCFFHAGKKAVHPCSGCGRFLCSLCDLEIGSEHLCASCVESGRKKGTMHQIESKRFLAAYFCQSLGILSLLVFCLPLGFVALPAQIVVWAMNRKKPQSLVRKRAWVGYAVGMTLSSLSILIFIAMILAGTWND